MLFLSHPLKPRWHGVRVLLGLAALASGFAPTPAASAAPASTLLRSESATPAPTGVTARAAAGLASQGLSPDQIRTAYGLPATGARGQTIAIISAYEDPYLESDLGAYDRRFGLPPCTTQSGCLRKLNQSGQSSPLPPTDPSGQWITESALGTEIAHGICQSCRILLVEASFADESDFSKAASTAAGAGATVIVTAFTGPETPQDSSLASDYSASRAAVVAAVGDPFVGQYGYSGGLNFPAALPNVLAVGGTQLHLSAANRYAGESAWPGTVSGCSFYETAPPWQKRISGASACGSMRADADLAAVAFPGAIVHITGAGQSGGPWYVAEGTSLSAPVIGSVIGLAGSAGSGEAQMLYDRELSDPGAFHDIVTGANASICRVSICKGARGWDGPTGLGTPAGLEAFLPAGPKISSLHPRISISAAKNQLRTSRRWTATLGLGNGNAFRISGSILVRRTLRIGGRLRLITFAQASFKRLSLGTGSIKLTIATSDRALLRSEPKLVVWASEQARGATGRSVTVSKKLTLLAP